MMIQDAANEPDATFAMTPEEDARLYDEYRAEMDTDWWSEAEMSYWDDDPNPYHGDYSEM
jgi:hypothetical protein